MQGRSDFIADHPDLIRRLRDAGLAMVLSGYETNDDDALAALRKQNTLDKNRRAAALLHGSPYVPIGASFHDCGRIEVKLRQFFRCAKLSRSTPARHLAGWTRP